jgi:outer membrane protein OmpA-like peptidoglycan-associated protein
LERARSVYSQARTDRDVQTYAPVPLADAGKALGAAEQAWCANKKEHFGYIAEKKSRIAVAVAEGKVAEREIDRLNQETAELMAEKCAQELRLSRKEAEQAKSWAAAEAEKAKEARREAEQARSVARAEAEKAERIKAEADQLMKELSDLQAKQTERGILIRMTDVLFETGKSNLSLEVMRSVDKLTEFLEKHPNRYVLIEGHTDSIGGDELNLALSQKRADAVKERLVAKGVAEKRTTTRGYGKKYPLASNETPAGRQQNRRVEVIILNEGVKPESQLRD